MPDMGKQRTLFHSKYVLRTRYISRTRYIGRNKGTSLYAHQSRNARM